VQDQRDTQEALLGALRPLVAHHAHRHGSARTASKVRKHWHWTLDAAVVMLLVLVVNMTVLI
jgi:hypothetical protein